ncbi:MAG: rod shape-determining protein RodA [Silvanigrellaceae bacterium]|nr:rod shape-determining protein RodA [Silvanigrellaceae bacterium]
MLILRNFIVERFKGVPWGILLNTYLLLLIGLYNLYSATNAVDSPDRFYYQLSVMCFGTFLIFFWGILLDIKTIERLALFGYIVVCVMLVTVDVFGSHAKGAERWLVVGPLRIQPSEFAKFMTILIVAYSFSHMKYISDFTLFSLWRQILFVGFPFLLILVQPDLGTAGLVLLIACIQISTVKVNWKSIAIVGAIGVTLALLAWNFVLYDYQKQRILTFINPMLDPRGAGYHSIQSMIAVGSGGVWGQGFGQGTQARLNFLPERHTDFIFSVWAEEHGFIGCLGVIFLFCTLILQIFQVAERAKDIFSSLVAIGVGAFFMMHFLINVSMVLGVFPVVGVPLSLISYGGSHLITAMSCIGLLIAIDRKRAHSLHIV